MQMPEMRIGRFRLPDSATAAEMDKLCAELLGSGSKQRKILITGCRSQEEAGFISMGLLRSLAEMGIRTVLVEADLRCSKLEETFEICVKRCEGVRYLGLCGYLRGQCDVDDILGRTGLKNADLILAGATAKNPMGLLAGGRFEKLINDLEKKYDMVLVLVPSIENSAVTMGQSYFCDGTLVVVRSGSVNSSELIQTMKRIKKSCGTVIGTVLCQFEHKTSKRWKSLFENMKRVL